MERYRTFVMLQNPAINLNQYVHVFNDGVTENYFTVGLFCLCMIMSVLADTLSSYG